MIDTLILCIWLSCFNLGHDNFFVRDKAHTNLGKCGIAILPFLEKYESHDLETYRRIQLLKLGFKNDILNLYMKRYYKGYYPFIDHLPLDYPNRNEIKQIYLSYADGIKIEDQEDWKRYKIAMEIFIRDSVLTKKTMTIQEAISLIEKTKESEMAWRKETNRPEK